MRYWEGAGNPGPGIASRTAGWRKVEDLGTPEAEPGNHLGGELHWPVAASRDVLTIPTKTINAARSHLHLATMNMAHFNLSWPEKWTWTSVRGLWLERRGPVSPWALGADLRLTRGWSASALNSEHTREPPTRGAAYSAFSGYDRLPPLKLGPTPNPTTTSQPLHPYN